MLAVYDFTVYSETEESVVKDGIIAQARHHIHHIEQAKGINTTEVLAFVEKAVTLLEPKDHLSFHLTSFQHTILPGASSTYYKYQYSLAYA